VKKIRQRYEMLFTLLLNSGLRLEEALNLKVREVRMVSGIAKSVRVIGKGNKERLVPLPEDFDQVFGSGSRTNRRRNLSLPRTLRANRRTAPPPGLTCAACRSGPLSRRK
jgi:site-specific recombinase XerD